MWVDLATLPSVAAAGAAEGEILISWWQDVPMKAVWGADEATKRFIVCEAPS